MAEKNIKDLQPDDMEPIIPGAKDASQYPGNESGQSSQCPRTIKAKRSAKSKNQKLDQYPRLEHVVTTGTKDSAD